MAKITWFVYKENPAGVYVDYTSKVLSMHIRQGREKYLDTYSGGLADITINNSTGTATNFGYGDWIVIVGNNGGQYSMRFFVQSVDFNDYPGNIGLSTATIHCVDWLSLAGRTYANALALTQTDTYTQLTQFSPILPGGITTSGLPASSIASATTYTGSVNNYINQLQTTERGMVYQYTSILNYVGRNTMSTLTPQAGAPTFDRTTATDKIAYQTFERHQNGVQFINTATIEPVGLTEQTAVNSTSVSTYGPASYSSLTVDYNTTQASGNAQWIANTFSDPAALYFAIGFTDVMQNATALAALNFYYPVWTLTYQAPNSSAVTLNVVMEGYEISVTPEQADFRITFSPFTYYQFFTLNSTTLGILNTSRLGW